jgi:hypothetical protein
MAMLRYLAEIFIDTFGITHPSPEGRDRAARYIAIIVVLLALLLFGIVAFAMHALHP